MLFEIVIDKLAPIVESDGFDFTACLGLNLSLPITKQLVGFILMLEREAPSP